jgi:hypothetical protein
MSITNPSGITNRWVVQPDSNVVQYNNKTSTWATSWGREVDTSAIRQGKNYGINNTGTNTYVSSASYWKKDGTLSSQDWGEKYNFVPHPAG